MKSIYSYRFSPSVSRYTPHVCNAFDKFDQLTMTESQLTTQVSHMTLVMPSPPLVDSD